MRYFRIQESLEGGFVQYWDKKYGVDKTQLCHQANNNRQRAAFKSRLSLSNLSGAFALLILGSVLSFLIFLIENIAARFIRAGKM